MGEEVTGCDVLYMLYVLELYEIVRNCTKLYAMICNSLYGMVMNFLPGTRLASRPRPIPCRFSVAVRRPVPLLLPFPWHTKVTASASAVSAVSV
jgi:hypothetical protein